MHLHEQGFLQLSSKSRTKQLGYVASTLNKTGGGGGSSSSGKGVYMFKSLGNRFADFISFFLNIL